MTGAEIYSALLQRGYSPEHAAALGGHMLQESGGDPSNVNQKEDAHGLLQWRGDRWTGLKNYAVSRNASPEDPNVQLDYVAREMAGPEAKSGAAFMAAGDLPSASAALKGYIRFGDNSDATRLQYGQSLLGGGDAGRSASPAAPVVSSSSGAAPPGELSQPPADDSALTTALQKIPEIVKSQQAAPVTATISPIEAPQPNVTPAMMRARQLAAAMVANSINPGSSST